MKRKIIKIFVVISLVILFSGCSRTYYSDSARPIINDDAYVYYGKPIRYKIVAIVENTEENRKKIKNSLVELRELYKHRESSLKKTTTVMTYEEIGRKCRTQVEARMYGRYKNFLEKRDLVDLCMQRNSGVKKDNYNGVEYFVYDDSESLHENVLYKFTMRIKVGSSSRDFTIVNVGAMLSSDKIVVMILGYPGNSSKLVTPFLYLHDMILNGIVKKEKILPLNTENFHAVDLDFSLENMN